MLSSAQNAAKIYASAGYDISARVAMRGSPPSGNRPADPSYRVPHRPFLLVFRSDASLGPILVLIDFPYETTDIFGKCIAVATIT